MMTLFATLYTISLALLVFSALGQCCQQPQPQPQPLQLQLCRDSSPPQVPMPQTMDDEVDSTTRAHWMRQASLALPGPCPFAAFGAVVVNHTAGGLGELICTGANQGHGSGNPTLHGEMVAINNCSAILTDPEGPYGMAPADALVAFADLTLYTNAESCPMCASAIRWAGFKEYVFGTSIDALVDKGWGQIRISSREVFRQSSDLPRPTKLIGPVLANETDVFFSWQFDPAAPCPEGCSRSPDRSFCHVA